MGQHTDEIIVDFFTARRQNAAQHPERLRRGKTGYPITSDVWHMAGFPLTTVAVVGLALNTLVANPWLNGASFPLRAIGCRLQAVGGAGSVVRIGIYRGDDITIYPTSLVLDSGVIDGTVAGLKTIPTTVSLDLGALYYFCMLIGVAAPTVQSANTWQVSMGWALDFSSQANGWTVPFAFGALPDPFPAGASLNVSSFGLVGVLGQ